MQTGVLSTSGNHPPGFLNWHICYSKVFECQVNGQGRGAWLYIYRYSINPHFLITHPFNKYTNIRSKKENILDTNELYHCLNIIAWIIWPEFIAIVFEHGLHLVYSVSWMRHLLWILSLYIFSKWQPDFLSIRVSTGFFLLIQYISTLESTFVCNVT
jgi:hypothetical protein